MKELKPFDLVKQEYYRLRDKIREGSRFDEYLSSQKRRKDEFIKCYKVDDDLEEYLKLGFSENDELKE